MYAWKSNLLVSGKPSSKAIQIYYRIYFLIIEY